MRSWYKQSNSIISTTDERKVKKLSNKHLCDCTIFYEASYSLPLCVLTPRTEHLGSQAVCILEACKTKNAMSKKSWHVFNNIYIFK